MIQRFIELGEGYSDIYELIELTNANQHRLQHMLALHTKIDDQDRTSLVVVLKPTDPGKFQALYICREGIPNPKFISNKRYDIFASTAVKHGKQIHELSVKPS
ncbi:MAG: methylthioribose kinase, partial [Bacillus sp. (in: firmicutes)]